jgi:hypothetical protein
MAEWREAINTIECELSHLQKFHVASQNPPSEYKVRWVETPSKIFWRVERPGSVDEFIWEDGVQKSLFNVGSNVREETGNLASCTKEQIHHLPQSPWHEVYCSRIGINSPPPPVFFKNSQLGIRIEPVGEGGSSKVKLVYNHPRGGFTEWVVDTAKGLLVSSKSLITPDGQNRVERKAEDIAEVSPGIHFPRRVVQRYYKKGQLAETATTTFTKVVINPPVDPDGLRVSFAPNTRIIDSSKRIVYRTDSQEQPVPSTIEKLQLSKDQLDAIEAARPWYLRWTYWLGIGGFVIVLGSTVGYVRRIVRARRLESDGPRTANGG